MFQLKRARSYSEEKSSTTNFTTSVDDKIYEYKDFPDLTQVLTRSAHVRRTTYNPIIEFAFEKILEWWCDRSIGNVFFRLL